MLTEKLIHIVNDVHDALATIDIRSQIDLPQIAVVGSQSSGKTSVLESIVGRDFLPRGSGIVTRCPLVLKLRNMPEGTVEYGEFTHRPNERITDFNEICREIEKRTASLAPENTTVSSTEIGLSVFSPNVLNLTLVDLPGLVSTAVGNQPLNIERQIKDMVMKFIAPENTIILAISPANADIANSQAIKAARAVDPQFKRTLGVLTKLDLMDEGTNAVEILENRAIPLTRGWIGVVNRSQKAVNEGRSMTAAREAETSYFEKHPDYARIANRNGTAVLASTLSHMLLAHIQKSMPELRRRVDDLISQTHRRQEELGMLDDSFTDPSAKLQRLLHQYQDLVRRCISGEGAPPGAKPGELRGGARLDEIFHRRFGDYISQMRAATRLTDDDIREVIRNAGGIEGNLFPSDRGFRSLARRQVRLLEMPCLKCIEIVHEELRTLCVQCSEIAKRHPKLHQEMQICVVAALEKFRGPAVAHIKTMIDAEEGFINVKHPRMTELIMHHFDPSNGIQQAGQAGVQQGAQQGAQAAGQQIAQHGGQPQHQPQHGQPQHQQQQPNQQMERTNTHAEQMAIHAAQSRYGQMAQRGHADFTGAWKIEGTLTPAEAFEHARLRELIEAYFTIVKGTVGDQVPKIIYLLMVQKLLENLGQVLLQRFHNPKEFEELLAEAPDIARMRKATTKMMDALVQAKNSLDKVRDLPPNAV